MKNFISHSSIFRCGATAGLDLLTIFLHWLWTVASTLPVMTTLVIRDTAQYLISKRHYAFYLTAYLSQWFSFKMEHFGRSGTF